MGSVPLERTTIAKLLGTELYENLKWNSDILKWNSDIPFHIRKQLTESLVLSFLDYKEVVCHPAPEYRIPYLQRVHLAAAGFVLNIYDVLHFG